MKDPAQLSSAERSAELLWDAMYPNVVYRVRSNLLLLWCGIVLLLLPPPPPRPDRRRCPNARRAYIPNCAATFPDSVKYPYVPPRNVVVVVSI